MARLTWATPPAIRMKQGGRTTITVTVTNSGAKSVQLDALEIVITSKKGRQPVALDAREYTRLLVLLPGIAPKKSKAFDVSVVGDSCVEANGYSLPPGTYSVYLLADNGTNPSTQVVVPPSPAIPLIVTA
jgi:hypothetical protein